MTQEVVGYHLIEVASNTVIMSWGGVWGNCPGLPNPIILPDGDHVHGAPLYGEFNGYQLVPWIMDEPPPQPPEEITRRQFYQQLEILGVITKAESIAAMKNVSLPDAISGYLASLTEEEAYTAEMLLLGATVFQRHHPLSIAMATAMGWTDEQVDGFWLAASQL